MPKDDLKEPIPMGMFSEEGEEALRRMAEDPEYLKTFLRFQGRVFKMPPSVALEFFLRAPQTRFIATQKQWEAAGYKLAPTATPIAFVVSDGTEKPNGREKQVLLFAFEQTEGAQNGHPPDVWIYTNETDADLRESLNISDDKDVSAGIVRSVDLAPEILSAVTRLNLTVLSSDDVRDFTRCYLSLMRGMIDGRLSVDSFGVTDLSEPIARFCGDDPQKLFYLLSSASRSAKKALLNVERVMQNLTALREVERSDEAKAEAEAAARVGNILAEETPQLDSLEFHFGTPDYVKSGGDRIEGGSGVFTSNIPLRVFALNHPTVSYALGSAILEYMDEKICSERGIKELQERPCIADYTINATIQGEYFTNQGSVNAYFLLPGDYIGGDSAIKPLFGGSLTESIKRHIEYQMKYPVTPKAFAQHLLDKLVPFLEAHSELTPEERSILDDFKKEFPIRTSFRSKLEAFEDRSIDVKKPIVVGDTPLALSLAGASTGPELIINLKKVRQCMSDPAEMYHGHALDIETMSKILEKLQEPVLLLKGNIENSIVAITDMTDMEGRQIMVTVQPGIWSGRHLANRITSVYGRKNMQNYLDKQIKAGNLIAMNIAKADELFQSLGLQSPQEETVIRFDPSIAYNMRSVKYPEQNFTKLSQSETQTPAEDDVKADIVPPKDYYQRKSKNGADTFGTIDFRFIPSKTLIRDIDRAALEDIEPQLWAEGIRYSGVFRDDDKVTLTSSRDDSPRVREIVEQAEAALLNTAPEKEVVTAEPGKVDTDVNISEPTEDRTDVQTEAVETPQLDSLEFHFGYDEDPEDVGFTESDLLRDFVQEHRPLSFALSNAILGYLDEKKNLEREDSVIIRDPRTFGYDKTFYHLHAVIQGEDFLMEDRFDIGDGFGSLIDTERQFLENGVEHTNDSAAKAPYQHRLDVLIPFLEAHSELTPEEHSILDDFKEQHPIRPTATKALQNFVADYNTFYHELDNHDDRDPFSINGEEYDYRTLIDLGEQYLYANSNNKQLVGVFAENELYFINDQEFAALILTLRFSNALKDIDTLSKGEFTGISEDEQAHLLDPAVIKPEFQLSDKNIEAITCYLAFELSQIDEVRDSFDGLRKQASLSDLDRAPEHFQTLAKYLPQVIDKMVSDRQDPERDPIPALNAFRERYNAGDFQDDDFLVALHSTIFEQNFIQDESHLKPFKDPDFYEENKYRYYSTLRPVTPVNIDTDAYVSMHPCDEKRFFPEIGKEAYGFISCNSPLPDDEVQRLDLTPVDPNYQILSELKDGDEIILPAFPDRVYTVKSISRDQKLPTFYVSDSSDTEASFSFLAQNADSEIVLSCPGRSDVHMTNFEGKLIDMSHGKPIRYAKPSETTETLESSSEEPMRQPISEAPEREDEEAEPEQRDDDDYPDDYQDDDECIGPPRHIR